MLPRDHVLYAIFLEHASQYFSIMVTLSPTSKWASSVARLPHVEQYFGFFSLGLCTKGLSAIRDFTTRFSPTPDKCDCQRYGNYSSRNNQELAVICHLLLVPSGT
jgi:hypothetical protein